MSQRSWAAGKRTRYTASGTVSANLLSVPVTKPMFTACPPTRAIVLFMIPMAKLSATMLTALPGGRICEPRMIAVTSPPTGTNERRCDCRGSDCAMNVPENTPQTMKTIATQAGSR